MHCTVQITAHSPARVQQLALVSLVDVIQRSLHRHSPQKQGTEHLTQIPRPQCCGQPLGGGGGHHESISHVTSSCQIILYHGMSHHLKCHIWVEAMHWGGVQAAPVPSWHLSQAAAASYFANPAARPPLPCLLACICSLGAARQCPPLPQQRSPGTSCCEGPDACARAVTGFTLRGSTSPDKEQKATSSCLAFAASACWWAGSAMWPWCPPCPCCICERARVASRSTNQSHVSGARSTTLQD